MSSTWLITNRITRMVTGDAADPRAPQVSVLVPVVAVLVLVAGFTPQELVNPTVVLGVAVVAVATLATFVVPWTKLPATALMSIPLLDLAAIGLLRLNPQVGAVGVVLVFPAMWLGNLFRWRGVVVVTLASIVVLAVPGLVYFGTGLEGWSRAVILPLVAFVTAQSMSETADLWGMQRAELEDQGAKLKRALEEVTEQRRLGEAIMETVDVGLLALGSDGAYNSMNRRHREFIGVGYPDGHAGRAGQLGYAFAADRVTALAYDEMPTVRAQRGEAFSSYTIWIGKDLATRRALSVSARPMLDELGQYDGAVLAYKDVTELMNALRVKDEFVALVSHELRTPLTSIIGYVDLTSDQAADLPDDVNHYLEVVGRNAERLLQLVSDLLTAAQAENGAIRLALEPIDLGDILRLSVAAAAPRATAAKVRVDLDLAPVGRVVADPGRLTQVAENLLSNAIKYTPAGGTVDIGLVQEGDEVALTVRDNGIGISEHEQGQMFTKFFRASTARERAIPGVGLGLVITKMIIDGHGGTIELDSVEGGGTTVRVRLPVGSTGAERRHVQLAVPSAAE